MVSEFLTSSARRSARERSANLGARHGKKQKLSSAPMINVYLSSDLLERFSKDGLVAYATVHW